MNVSSPTTGRTERMALAAHVLLDEVILRFVRKRQPPAQPLLSARADAEIEALAGLAVDQAWSADPVAYHRDPPALTDRDIEVLGTIPWPRRHEYVAFSSGFRPRSIEPGADRWNTFSNNETVYVRLLRHSTPRPWVVCLHGFGMSGSRFELGPMWAHHFHHKLGFNVAVPALPFHGPRKSDGNAELLSLDLAMTVHGITQAIWDIRRLIRWLGADGSPVGVYGLSLGGFLTSLLAGLEPVDCVISSIPFVDVLDLMAHHGPPAEYAPLLGSEHAREAFQLVSPLALTPLVPADRRSVVAGQVDQLIPTKQSEELDRAWHPSPVHWYSGGHAGYVWSRRTRASITDFLGDTLGTAQS